MSKTRDETMSLAEYLLDEPDQLDIEHTYDYHVCTGCMTDIHGRITWDVDSDRPFCSAQCMRDYLLETI
jgi:hypothetical protein